MKYLKSYSKLFEASIPTNIEVCASDISSSLRLMYEHVWSIAKEMDLTGETLTIKAKNGPDYFVSFDENDVVVTTKDNTSTFYKLLDVANISSKPDNEAFMLYMDINERFGTLFDFICEIISQI